MGGTITHARFNGFFTQKGIFDIKIKSRMSQTGMRYCHSILTQTKAQPNRFTPMERAIEKSSKVVDKHTSKRHRKYFKRPELNKWIDDNYMVIGKATTTKKTTPNRRKYLYLARTVKPTTPSLGL